MSSRFWQGPDCALFAKPRCGANSRDVLYGCCDQAYGVMVDSFVDDLWMRFGFRRGVWGTLQRAGGGALHCLDGKRAPRAQKVENEARGNRFRIDRGARGNGSWGEGEWIMA